MINDKPETEYSNKPKIDQKTADDIFDTANGEYISDDDKRFQSNEPNENRIDIDDQSSASGENQKCKNDDVSEFGAAKKKIRSGFMWLGISSILSQVLDALSLIVVMMYLTKAEMGLATLAVIFTKCLEAFNSLGVGKALVQDKDLTENETHSLFWLAFGVGVIVFIVMIPVAVGTAIFYNNDALFMLILVSLIRMLIGGIGDVPKKLVERRLEYAKCTLILVIATLVSGFAKIILAVAGAGAWALVLAHVLYGIAYLIAAFVLSQYRPKFHFKWSECKRFVQFGIRYCGSNLIENLNKNIHYFIVGKFFGESILGVYRVGYEIAMTPAMALLNVVNESSYAVFAKVKDKKKELSSLFAWNQGNIAIFSLVPILFILFCSKDIFSLVNHGQWMSAVSFIPFALIVAFVKSLAQTFPELYRACGNPGFALRTDAFECVLICVFFVAALLMSYLLGLDDESSLINLFCAWILLFVPLLAYHLKLAGTLISTGLMSTIKSISKALVFGVIASIFSIPLWMFQDKLPFAPWGHIAAEVIIMLICIGVYAKWIRKKNVNNESA